MEQGNRSDSTLMSDRQASPDRIRFDDREGVRAAAIERMLTKPVSPVEGVAAAQRTEPRQSHPLRALVDAGVQQLSAVRAKAGKLIAVDRMMPTKRGQLRADPRPAEPPVDRVALVNYATWLHMERTRICAELYPGMGRRCTAFFLTLNAAERFFYPHGINAFDSKAHLRVPPASTRAVKILDMVGVAWRNDLNDSTREHFASSEDPESQRWLYKEPRPPHRWPAPDAILLEALDDLSRIDAAQVAMGKHGDADRDADDVPGYDALEEARGAALDRLTKERAESLTGLQAKARALLTTSVKELPSEHFADIAASLSRDLLAANPAWLDHRPDPIFATIADNQRLWDAWTETNALPEVPGTLDRPPEAEAACTAFNDHTDETLLKTVPTTAEGCRALAKYVGEFQVKYDYVLDCQEDPSGENLRVLSLIARSPLL